MISEAEIQHHFIGRFVETHGDAPEGFTSAIYKRAPKSATINSLEAAAERIIRTKKSKSFPSFAESLAAIVEASGSGVSRSAPGSLAKLVTADNYEAMALDHMRLNAAYGSMGAMIEPGTDEWGLWAAYFIAKDIQRPRMVSIESFARRPAIDGVVQWDVTARYMVPTRFPIEFDHDAPSKPTTWADHFAEQKRREYFQRGAATQEKAA